MLFKTNLFVSSIVLYYTLFFCWHNFNTANHRIQIIQRERFYTACAIISLSVINNMLVIWNRMVSKLIQHVQLNLKYCLNIVSHCKKIVYQYKPWTCKKEFTGNEHTCIGITTYNFVFCLKMFFVQVSLFQKRAFTCLTRVPCILVHIWSSKNLLLFILFHSFSSNCQPSFNSYLALIVLLSLVGEDTSHNLSWVLYNHLSCVNIALAEQPTSMYAGPIHTNSLPCCCPQMAKTHSHG